MSERGEATSKRATNLSCANDADFNIAALKVRSSSNSLKSVLFSVVILVLLPASAFVFVMKG